MNWDFLNYELPQDRIAQRLLPNRSDSKLLHLNRATGELSDHRFSEVVQLLRKGDLLVLNDTRVTALRLLGAKTTGGHVEFLLLKETGENEFEALAKPGKRLQPGTQVVFANGLVGEVTENLDGGRKRVRLGGPEWRKVLEKVGRVPLPPYIHEELQEPERYQTAYAEERPGEGSAAAPTAGLHFTRDLFEQLHEIGVDVAYVSLDVGIDTFRPITADDPLEHSMHGEVCRISPDQADKINRTAGRIIAVGTTAVRTLESFAIGHREVKAGEMNTAIYITPGYSFQVIDGMFTNFHMPKTTMLLMIAALAGGEAIATSYRHALDHEYRFLSFGDSMLIL
jgi:S-adenosylmethionine:tRNA ribosyltransferase-isomerase